MTISIKVTGSEEVEKILADLPLCVKIAAMRAASEEFIGDDNHG